MPWSFVFENNENGPSKGKSWITKNIIPQLANLFSLKVLLQSVESDEIDMEKRQEKETGSRRGARRDRKIGVRGKQKRRKFLIVTKNTLSSEEKLRSLFVGTLNYPKPGIIFRDIFAPVKFPGGLQLVKELIEAQVLAFSTRLVFVAVESGKRGEGIGDGGEERGWREKGRLEMVKSKKFHEISFRIKKV